MKSLIVYATKHGCTEKAANILESKLGGEVRVINVMKESVPSLDDYDNVILGGSIYMGRIQKQLTDYVSRNLPMLLKKKIGLFICAGSPDLDARAKELETSFPSELISHAISKELFGYEIVFEKLGFLEKGIMKAVKGDKESVSELSEESIISLAKAMSA